LDEKEYTLTEQNLLITDGQKPVALAGVMGGEESSIAADTTEIFLESANFEAANNRQTAAALGVRTDSSMRYEKSLDPTLCEQALKRMVEIIQETCPEAYIASEVFDVNNWKDPQIKLKIDAKTISKKAGVEIKAKEVKDILLRLGFQVDEKLNVKVPSWRATKDILTPIDLVEEVIRIYGYDKIPYHNPHWPLQVPPESQSKKLERKIKQILTSCNCYEVINYNFVGEELVKKLGLKVEDHIKLRNPLASDQSMLRTSLLANLLLAAQRNLRFQEQVALFEIGSVFLKKAGKLAQDDQGKEKLPLQKKYLSILCTGDFYTAKKVLESILSALKLTKLNYRKIALPACETSAVLEYNKQILGEIGTLTNKLSKEFDLPETSYFTLDLDLIAEILPAQGKYEELAKFPAVKRDFAVLLVENKEVGPFLENIKALDKLIVEIKLFDVYRGEKIPAGQKSVAFNLTFQDPEKTLSEEEISRLQKQIVAKIEALGGKLRG
ncbi:MAG: phenylalanine--tRNA ligase subunit beta, partial [Candidatus Gracilibacteria bacterium]|nr:phenylalanine--tRNA ligase subunit beta [Candidatus Gracilibacteria bacterium]